MKEEENFWDKLMGTDEGAATYMQAYGEGPGCETRMMISEFINDGESVLDVGCGPGWNYDHFQEYGPKIGNYLGIDYSKRFVRVANLRNPGQYEYGDARFLPAPDESWDVVLLQDILEHTNGYEQPVLEALRVAKKRVIISFWHLVHDDNEHINDDGEDGYGAWYNGKRWEAWLETLGYHWMSADTSSEANRQHKFYIIDKLEKHGN